MTTAAAYIRVSSERQDEYSPDSQIRLIGEYAEKHGYTIPDEYIFFDDGISAKSVSRRTQFNKMIALAKEKSPPFEAILVWKFSRFARNQEESIVYKKLLRKKGIQVISISEPIADSPFGDLIERIIEWMDEYYLINLSAEVKRGMEERISRGEPLCPPAFGYDISDGKYIVNEKEAEYVRSFFYDYLHGIPIKQIVMRCNAENLRTHRGNPFEVRTVRYILSNPVYIGKLRRFDNKESEMIDGIHEPIVSLSLWNAVQKKLSSRQRYERRGLNTQWRLKGLMRCECGATLTRLSVSDPSMQCHRYAKGGGCKVSHYLSIEKANRLVSKNLKSIISDREIIIDFSEPNTRRSDFSALLKAENLKLEKAKAAYLSGIDTLDEYRQSKEKILKSIALLEEELHRAKKESTFAPTKSVRRIFEALDDPTVSESAKNEALRAIISKIVFNKTENCLDFYFHM